MTKTTPDPVRFARGINWDLDKFPTETLDDGNALLVGHMQANHIVPGTPEAKDALDRVQRIPEVAQREGLPLIDA